jgi:hypothetical protein
MNMIAVSLLLLPIAAAFVALRRGSAGVVNKSFD